MDESYYPNIINRSTSGCYHPSITLSYPSLQTTFGSQNDITPSPKPSSTPSRQNDTLPLHCLTASSSETDNTRTRGQLVHSFDRPSTTIRYRRLSLCSPSTLVASQVPANVNHLPRFAIPGSINSPDCRKSQTSLLADMAPDLNSLPPSPAAHPRAINTMNPSGEANIALGGESPPPASRSASISLQAAATMNAGLQHEPSRRTTFLSSSLRAFQLSHLLT